MEYVYYNDFSLNRCYVIDIDLSTKQKTYIYVVSSSESELIGSNVLNNYYYFTLGSDALYVVTEKGQIQDTKLRSVYSSPTPTTAVGSFPSAR